MKEEGHVVKVGSPATALRLNSPIYLLLVNECLAFHQINQS